MRRQGEEGFQENKAYRELRSILRSFLIQIAADFFREKGVSTGSGSQAKSGK